MEISKVIKAHNMTLQQVADGLGVSLSSIKKTIAKDGNPTLETLRKLASVIGCPVSEFFIEEENKGKDVLIDCPHCGLPIVINVHV